MGKKENIFQAMEDDINKSNLDEESKNKIFENILKLKNQKVNILITGATGSGKSSTINAMFNTEVANIGVGVDPETMSITKYELDNLILWDSPGLGDGKENDIRHSKAIITKLNELDSNNNPLIDLVLVILDGSSRDLGTSYELINQVVIPNIGKKSKDRVLIAINQCDVAMKGRYWDYENNKPLKPLVKFLQEKVQSVRKRVKEATDVDIEPIYYSAGFKDGDNKQNPYNLSKLIYFIVKNTPTKKRLAYVDNLSNDKQMWQDDDRLKEYTKETKKSIIQTVKEYASSGADIGGEIGSIFGSVGRKVGETIGGVVGAACGFVSSIFGW
jgi:predicted GTPase